MDSVNIGRTISVIVPISVLLLVVAVVRCRVLSLGSVAMVIVFLVNLAGFSVYAWLSRTLGIIPDYGEQFNYLWSVAVRLHSALTVGHYIVSFSVEYAKRNEISLADLVARLWT